MKKDKDIITVDKAANTARGESYSKQRMKTYFQFSMISVAFVMVFAVIYYVANRRDTKNAVDYSQVQLIQFMQPADDAPVAVYETDKGTFKALLFPEQTPNYYQHFTEQVKAGYYDGTSIFAVQDGVYFMGGSKTADGTDDEATDKTELDAELHRDLWPFYGAIAAYGNRKSLTHPQVQSGSRSLFIGSVEFTDEFVKELEEATDNTVLAEAFKTHKGVPNFSQQYTIFAQVYDGFDAYDSVLAAEVVKPAPEGEEGGSDVDLSPKEPIKINKVTISTYGENRCDSFFTGK